MNVLSERIENALRKALKKTGYPEIKPSYTGILFTLEGHGGKMELLNVYNELLRPRSTVSDMAKRLEKIGFITKEHAPDNAKKVLLVSTPKTVNLHNEMIPELEKIRKKVYAGFTEEEQHEHIRLTIKAFENLKD
jgi:DNA-binding MarR family transcriptional regulator